MDKKWKRIPSLWFGLSDKFLCCIGAHAHLRFNISSNLTFPTVLDLAVLWCPAAHHSHLNCRDVLPSLFLSLPTNHDRERFTVVQLSIFLPLSLSLSLFLTPSLSWSIYLSLSLYHSQYMSLVSIFLILSLYSYSLFTILFLSLIRSHSALYTSFSFLSLHLSVSFFLPLSTHAHAPNYLKICKIVWRSASAFKHQKTIPDLMILRKDKMMFSTRLAASYFRFFGNIFCFLIWTKILKIKKIKTILSLTNLLQQIFFYSLKNPTLAVATKGWSFQALLAPSSRQTCTSISVGCPSQTTRTTTATTVTTPPTHPSLQLLQACLLQVSLKVQASQVT